MFDKDFFQQPVTGEPGRFGGVAGKMGVWILHIAKVAFLIYSGYHGVSASLSYAGNSEIAKFAQIVGIVVLEFSLFGLYLAWHNQRITGTVQSIAAVLIYLIGFVLACLGIVGDSQLHAVGSPSPWLVSYLTWGLPIAPAIMALGALLVHELAPEQIRSFKWGNEKRQFEETQFKGQMASMMAELQAAIDIKNMQLNAQAAAVKQIAAWYNSDQAQDAIKTSALQNAPALLRAIGVDIPDANQNGKADPAFRAMHHWVLDEAERRGVSQLDILSDLVKGAAVVDKSISQSPAPGNGVSHKRPLAPME